MHACAMAMQRQHGPCCKGLVVLVHVAIQVPSNAAKCVACKDASVIEAEQFQRTRTVGSP